MKEWYTAKEIAQANGVSVQATKKRANKENWQPSRPRTGRGGGLEYHLSSLPETTRLHLFSFHARSASGAATSADAVPPECFIEGSGLSFSPPTPRNTFLSTTPGPSTSFPAGPAPAPSRIPIRGAVAPTNPLPAATIVVPEKDRRIALARLDLVRLWQEYRNPSSSRAMADAEFVQTYNTGNLFPAIHAILGSVSLPTLYRWLSTLSGTENWTLLAPQYRTALRSARLTPDEAHVFFGILLHPNKVKIGRAVSLTEFYFRKAGRPLSHSAMTFRRAANDYKAQHYDRWVLLREGEKALTEKVTFSIRRDVSLLEVGECLVADGHRLNFQIVNPYTGKPCRATMVGYLDWKSWDLVGYEIMIEESTQCIASAFRNAILRLGKAPSVLYLDNGRAFRSRFFTSVESFEEEGVYGLFARLGTRAIFARPYNARAKVIERWFQEFSESFERLVPSYTGASIEDKPARLMRNERWHKALYKGYVPTIVEAVEMIREWHEFHRSRPCPHVKGRTIGEVFDEGRGTGVDPRELDDLMMTAKATRIGPNGIRFLGADYYHEVMHGLREQCTIRYSLFDLSFVLVYDSSGEYLCRAERPALAHPIASASENPCDMETVKRLNAAQKALKRHTMIESEAERRSLGPVNHEWAPARQQPQALSLAPKIDPVLPPPAEEHIPEEAVSLDNSFLPSDEPRQDNIRHEDVFQEKNVRPFFSGQDADVQRYEWHLAHGFHGPEDMGFKLWFESTDMYRMLYVMIPAQRADVQ